MSRNIDLKDRSQNATDNSCDSLQPSLSTDDSDAELHWSLPYGWPRCAKRRGIEVERAWFGDEVSLLEFHVQAHGRVSGS